MFKRKLNRKSIFFVGLVTLLVSSMAHADIMLNGAGASFPYPIYSKWFDAYHNINPDVRINYQSIGSGGGIRQFSARVVDFGATDDPMSDKQIARVNGDVHHIPTVLGAVVPTFNVEGIDHLNFSGEVLAAIFLGEIKYWNDPAIAKLNPGVDLPRKSITTIHRSDGSGTTFCFTDYLTAVSPHWKQKVGAGQSVNWPGGIGAKGNEGVSGMVRQVEYSLGYVELIYAKRIGMPYGSVLNRAGKFVKADVNTVTEAAANSSVPEDFRVSIVNADGANSYPISTYTWLLIRANNGENAPIIKGFLNWMLSDGQSIASQLDYAPLPDDVKLMVKKTVQKIQ